MKNGNTELLNQLFDKVIRADTNILTSLTFTSSQNWPHLWNGNLNNPLNESLFLSESETTWAIQRVSAHTRWTGQADEEAYLDDAASEMGLGVVSEFVSSSRHD